MDLARPFKASKWLTVNLLLDENEMEALLDALGEVSLYQTWKITKPGEEILPKETFLNIYREYVKSLKNGMEPEESNYKGAFSSLLSMDKKAVNLYPTKDQKQLVRQTAPAIQMRPHTTSYSREEGLFRSMNLGKDQIQWGIQFSYPQLFLSPVSGEIETVDQSAKNSACFKTLRRFVRENSRPTPFVVDGKKTNVPIRLGKNCFSWINQHPTLKRLGVLCHGS